MCDAPHDGAARIDPVTLAQALARLSDKDHKYLISYARKMLAIRGLRKFSTVLDAEGMVNDAFILLLEGSQKCQRKNRYDSLFENALYCLEYTIWSLSGQAYGHFYPKSLNKQDAVNESPNPKRAHPLESAVSLSPNEGSEDRPRNTVSENTLSVRNQISTGQGSREEHELLLLLERLPEQFTDREREVITRYIVHGHNYQKIRREMGIALATISGIMTRFKEWLRDK